MPLPRHPVGGSSRSASWWARSSPSRRAATPTTWSRSGSSALRSTAVRSSPTRSSPTGNRPLALPAGLLPVDMGLGQPRGARPLVRVLRASALDPRRRGSPVARAGVPRLSGRRHAYSTGGGGARRARAVVSRHLGLSRSVRCARDPARGRCRLALGAAGGRGVPGACRRAPHRSRRSAQDRAAAPPARAPSLRALAPGGADASRRRGVAPRGRLRAVRRGREAALATRPDLPWTSRRRGPEHPRPARPVAGDARHRRDAALRAERCARATRQSARRRGPARRRRRRRAFARRSSPSCCGSRSTPSA